MSNLTTPSEPSTTEAARRGAERTTAAATEEARAVASTGADQARAVAHHAREEAGSVAGEAKAQADKVIQTATSELNTQLEERLSHAAASARDTAGQLRALADGRTADAGPVGDLARRAGDEIERLAGRADELGLKGITDEVTDFARRRPVAFLVGAAAAGLLVGRLVRAGKEAPSSADQPIGPRGYAGAGEQTLIDLTRAEALPPQTSPPTAQPPDVVEPVAAPVVPPDVLPPVLGEPGLHGEVR